MAVASSQDDLVYCRIFPDFPDRDDVNLKAELEALRDECLSLVYPAAGDYIWQHEIFNLRVCSSPSDCHFPYLQGNSELVQLENDIAGVEFSTTESFVPHLFGKVRFGDNLEDEWLVVWFLFEISRRNPNVSITVRDSDGEFLLIEAAYAIPKWLMPENSQNRVFIRQGKIHLVPPTPTTPLGAHGEQIPTKNALRVLRSNGVDTRVSDKVMEAILHRMVNFPENALKHVHRARCRLPVSVAQVLKHEPQMISLAVEAFYNRDVDSLKAANQMEKFLPGDDTAEMVDVIVHMSRPMYAQLRQQQFQAPRRYPMPSDLSGARFLEAELGMKISCGFEMMYYERSPYDSETTSMDEEEEVGVSDISSQVLSGKKVDFLPSGDLGWQVFKASLEKNGYFRNYLEGSRDHQELLQAAVMRYRSTNMSARTSAAMRAPVKRIDQLLSLAYNAGHFADAPPQDADSDEWLYDGEKELTVAMAERQKEMENYEAKQVWKSGKGNSEAGETGTFEVENVVKSMRSFVDNISSFEGAELPRNDDAQDDVDPVSLSMAKLIQELGAIFSPEEIANMFSPKDGPDEDSDGESDTDPDLSEEESDHEYEEPNPSDSTSDSHQHMEGGNEDGEAIHSGNRDNSMFAEAYSSALDKQLQNSTLAKSFVQRSEKKNESETADAIINMADRRETSNGPASKDDIGLDDKMMSEREEGDDDENDLVDVDANLVESFLRSFMHQEGMPGPASNLLGSMGVDLPDNADKRPKWKETIFWEARLPADSTDLYDSSSGDDA